MSRRTDSLTRPVSLEERSRLLADALAAFDKGDESTGYSLLKQIPLLPSLAKLVFEAHGRNDCEANFNLSDAYEKFGEGWMNEPY